MSSSHSKIASRGDDGDDDFIAESGKTFFFPSPHVRAFAFGSASILPFLTLMNLCDYGGRAGFHDPKLCKFMHGSWQVQNGLSCHVGIQFGVVWSEI